jgi:hypothetical protein
MNPVVEVKVCSRILQIFQKLKEESVALNQKEGETVWGLEARRKKYLIKLLEHFHKTLFHQDLT